jgi:hypothetical protein
VDWEEASGMQIVDSIVAVFRNRKVRVASRGELVEFLRSRAAFLSQKCVTEFCRVRSGPHWEKLFRETEFQDALLRSCWLAHAPALAMLSEVVSATLRPAAVGREAELLAALVAAAAEVRGSLAVPPNVETEIWAAQAGLVEVHLAKAFTTSPRPVREMAEPLARQVFEYLPIHQNLLTNDYDYIFNNLRINLLRAHEELLSAGHPDEIVAELVR